MWVYTTEKSQHPVVIFEYQKTRTASHPKKQDHTECSDELNVSREALHRIGELFDMDKAYRNLSADERLENVIKSFG